MATTVDASGLRRAVVSRGGFIVQRARLDIDRELHRRARPHRVTGEMENAIRVTDQRLSPTVWRIVAENRTVQAATTNTGARPHEIRPVKASVLRFVVDGRVVYAKVVHHPGNKGDRWFSSTFDPASIRAMFAKFVGR